MKKKYLIVVADYYKDIADGLIRSALKHYLVIPIKPKQIMFTGKLD